MRAHNLVTRTQGEPRAHGGEGFGPIDVPTDCDTYTSLLGESEMGLSELCTQRCPLKRGLLRERGAGIEIGKPGSTIACVGVCGLMLKRSPRGP